MNKTSRGDSHKKNGTLLRQSALLVLSLFSDRVEQFLRILRLPGELLLLPAGCLGFLHAAKFLGGVFQPQVSVSVERDADFECFPFTCPIPVLNAKARKAA